MTHGKGRTEGGDGEVRGGGTRCRNGGSIESGKEHWRHCPQT